MQPPPRQNSSACAVCCLGILFGIFMLIGACLIPGGLSEIDEAKQMDPANDFTALNDGCVITGAIHQEKQTEESNGQSQEIRCWDKFTYEFVVTGRAEYADTYISHVEKKARCKQALA